jgi:hypothetical protein
MVTLRAGHDVAYFTRGSCAGGCVGAMSYYTASGEPPGQWAGKGPGPWAWTAWSILA